MINLFYIIVITDNSVNPLLMTTCLIILDPIYGDKGIWKDLCIKLVKLANLCVVRLSESTGMIESQQVGLL